MDENRKQELDSTCSCGGGKPAGACCSQHESFPCGSGKEVGSCCYTGK